MNWLCHHSTNFKHFARGKSLICLGTTKPPSLFPTLSGFPPWVSPLLEVVPLACLVCWYNSPNLFGLFASGHFSAQAFCCCYGVPLNFYLGPSASMLSAILMIPMSLKKIWELKQGVHHQFLLSHLGKYIS